jgi:hypothetical protein
MGAERQGDAIVLKVPALPAAARHLKLFEYPSYLALALENNGFSPSYSSRLIVKSRSEFEIRNASVRFVGRKGSIFQYEASLKLPLGGGGSTFRVPLEVDVSSLSAGSVVMRVYPPMSSLIPADLIERIESKARSLANDATQRQMLQYLDDVSKNQKAGDGVDAALEKILLDAYNRASTNTSSGRDVGDAEPLAEQYALIATLLIWLTLLPLIFFGRVWQKARRIRRAQADEMSASG